jgi:autotransporter-associated beta strand protein
MKTKLTTFKSDALPRFLRATSIAGLLPALVLLLSIQSSHAASATWLATPATGDWNTAANWTTGGPPNGSADTATFASSNITGVSLSNFTEVNGIVFNAGASAFTITASPTLQLTLTISGVGITNNSGIAQNFVTAVDQPGNRGAIFFVNGATAGSLTTFINNGAFAACTTCAGETDFFNTSTAGNGTFIMNGGAAANAAGGHMNFSSTSTAGNGAFTINGGAVSLAGGGLISFGDTTNAGNAILIVNGGLGGGVGGLIQFSSASTGGTARVEVFGNGTGDFTNGNLDISSHSLPGVTIGSIEGSGAVFLGANNLTVGSNNLSTAFSGKIQDGGIGGGTGGSLTKMGRGKLTLSRASTYTGGTTVSKGTLFVTNRTGSATGTGTVLVKAGTLSGTGKITGAVTVASGTAAAILAPGIGTSTGTLTILSTLAFNANATYQVDLNSSTPAADQVVAKGVTINSGALVTIDDLGISVLASGTVFTIISNTAATPIAGTFSNLADGSTLTVGSNTYLVSYEGGTGNDLTLTVQ